MKDLGTWERGHFGNRRERSWGLVETEFEGWGWRDERWGSVFGPKDGGEGRTVMQSSLYICN